MTLNASGPISLGGPTTGQSINLELSQGASAQVSLNDTNVRTLAGVASGAITMPTNFYGKSAGATWTPDGGATAGTAVGLSEQMQLYASITISCTVSAVWNYTETGTGSASIASGGSGTSITFQVSTTFGGGFKFANFTVNSVAGGVTKYWTVALVAEDGS